jgi:two-component system C4-dicarboxylate transport sensor histidine kinase DctB
MKAAPRQHGAAPHATQAPSAQMQARAAAEALDEFDAFGDEER